MRAHLASDIARVEDVSPSPTREHVVACLEALLVAESIGRLADASLFARQLRFACLNAKLLVPGSDQATFECVAAHGRDYERRCLRRARYARCRTWMRTWGACGWPRTRASRPPHDTSDVFSSVVST